MKSRGEKGEWRVEMRGTIVGEWQLKKEREREKTNKREGKREEKDRKRKRMSIPPISPLLVHPHFFIARTST